jgi:hypothetical protein
MSDLEYVGCQVYEKDKFDKWKIMILHKQYLPESETRENDGGAKVNYIMKHQFLYPYISGWYRGKWTHNPNDISKFPKEVQKVCKETWTDRFKESYKRWRESVGPHFN